MALRDLFLFAVLLALVFVVPRRPYVGALAWVVFGVLNPHRLTWGPAFNFPFSQVIVILTLIGMLLQRAEVRPKGGPALAVLALLYLWCCVNTITALIPDQSLDYLIRITKVYFMTVVLIMVLNTQRHAILLVWALALSLGFYGMKGGLFVLATGGSYMVNGPPDSVMDGNNSLGVGLVVIIPLLFFLHKQVTSRWLRWGLVSAMVLCAISVLGSYSRGALLAILAMGLVLWIRGKNKLMVAVAAVMFVLVAIPAMPEAWMARMLTIQTYQEEGSAMGRIVAWETAYNIAKDRFPLGGGFEWQSQAQSERYSPVPTMVLVPHSIYFEVLGTQGFIGLGLYLLFWFLVWRDCAWIRRTCREREELQWAFTLASMTQVGLVGFFVGGAFLNLAFWDLPYYLFAAIAVTRHVVAAELKPKPAASSRSATSPGDSSRHSLAS